MKRPGETGPRPGDGGPRGRSVRPVRRRSENLERVGSVLDQVLPALRLDERFASAQATDFWRDVAGPEVARRTRAVGVRDGELLVEVNGSVWMGHLALLRRGYLDEINERLPAEARLRAIRLAPMSDTARDKEGS